MTQAGIFETFSLFIGSIVVSIISKRINNRNGVLLLGFYLGIYLSVISLINMFLINDIRFDYILFACKRINSGYFGYDNIARMRIFA